MTIMSQQKKSRKKKSDAGQLPLNAQSARSMDYNLTGSWKVVEPYYADLRPPCVGACPAGSDVVSWVGRAGNGSWEEAYEMLLESNPFPAICGRVCPAPCETACTRRALGGSVGVRQIERRIGDFGLESGKRIQVRGKHSERVAVVGSGPAGLSCAFYLARQGFLVTVFEALSKVGGLLATGIPAFRLPRDVMDRQMSLFQKLPVQFEMGRRLGANLSREDLGRFDATFLAVGRQASRRLGIPGEDLPGVVEGLSFLREIGLGSKPEVGARVVVVGGGNTALDCARSALRLGGRPVIAYRRTEAEMPAFEEEVAQGREEGVELLFQVAPVAVLEKEGRTAGMRLIRMKQGDPDESGRRRPVPIEGSEFDIEADMILLAAGEEVDPGPLGDRMPPKDRIFAGGDLMGGGTVSEAIGHGRHGAAAIEKLLIGKTGIVEDLLAARNGHPEGFSSDRINRAYFCSSSPTRSVSLSPGERAASFQEIVDGLDSSAVMEESKRCLSCGTCAYCDNCLILCPDRAIVRDGDGYRVLYEYCKGCGICVEECPRGAIHIRDVTT